MEMIEKDEKWMERTKLLIGSDAIQILKKSHVLIVGLGGVGSYCAEAIARAGVGELTIVDGDVVDPSNRNRQLQALYTTHGLSKANLMAERIMQINPNCRLNVHKEFKTPDKVVELLQQKFDYVVDAIDSLTPKIYLIKTAFENGHKLVSSMGAGGKLDPTMLEVVDIEKTKICPFAQQVRKKLREHKIYRGFKAVYSTEIPDKNSIMFTDGSNFKKSAYGTISFIPAVFGLTCASVVIRDLIGR
jgi:tRNA A37 threonylcarbamoyladenosine dehydratase